jgi:hypothetical protein
MYIEASMRIRGLKVTSVIRSLIECFFALALQGLRLRNQNLRPQNEEERNAKSVGKKQESRFERIPPERGTISASLQISLPSGEPQ